MGKCSATEPHPHPSSNSCECLLVSADLLSQGLPEKSLKVSGNNLLFVVLVEKTLKFKNPPKYLVEL